MCNKKTRKRVKEKFFQWMPTSISCKTAGIFRFQQPTNKNNLKTVSNRQIKTTPFRLGQISNFFLQIALGNSWTVWKTRCVQLTWLGWLYSFQVTCKTFYIQYSVVKMYLDFLLSIFELTASNPRIFRPRPFQFLIYHTILYYTILYWIYHILCTIYNCIVESIRLN